MTLKNRLRLTAAKRVSVHCPACDAAQEALLAGDLQRLETLPPFDALFAVLRGHVEFGSIGPYRSVFELSMGRETFVPGPDASPSEGTLGTPSFLTTIVIMTYIPEHTPRARIEELITRLAAAHPWELPVIEVSLVDLLQ